MTDNEEEKLTQEQEIRQRYHGSLINEVKRLNANYTGLEDMTIETLEALKKMELEKVKKDNIKPKPTFQSIKTPKTDVDPQRVENSEPEVRRFNRLQIFHPQFTPIETMPTYKKNNTIFTMMIHPDPRYPEWQVS